MTINRALRLVDCASPQENPHPNIKEYALAGHKHIARKVSEGIGYHWSYGDTICHQAHDAKLRVGNYHWLRPDSDAVAQANYFMTLCGALLRKGDWVMVDYEWPWDHVSD